MSHTLPPSRVLARAVRKLAQRTGPGTAYGYLRVSTEDQDCEPQRAAVTAHYEARLRPLGFAWGGWYEDWGVSGTTPFFDRPEGCRLNTVLDRGDAVIVAHLDRAFRNLRDCLGTVDTWLARGIQPHILGLDIPDLASEAGELQLTMLGAIAQYERRRISSRTKAGLAVARAKGKLLGQPPYGFKAVRINATITRVVPDPEERAQVQEFIRRMENGATAHDLHLEELQSRRKRGRTGRTWAENAIRTCVRAELQLQADEQYRAEQAAREKDTPTP